MFGHQENKAKNNYCMKYAQLILEKAEEDLNDLTFQLDGNGYPKPEKQ